jgi:hypothetical protein
MDHGAVSSLLTGLLEVMGLRKRQLPNLGLRPHRKVDIPLGIEAAHERVLDAFARVLGANVYLDDRTTGTIEGGFGTVNQERIQVTLHAEGAIRTNVSIEALYPAGVERRPRSPAVDALADALSSRS